MRILGVILHILPGSCPRTPQNDRAFGTSAKVDL